MGWKGWVTLCMLKVTHYIILQLFIFSDRLFNLQWLEFNSLFLLLILLCSGQILKQRGVIMVLSLKYKEKWEVHFVFANCISLYGELEWCRDLGASVYHRLFCLSVYTILHVESVDTTSTPPLFYHHDFFYEKQVIMPGADHLWPAKGSLMPPMLCGDVKRFFFTQTCNVSHRRQNTFFRGLLTDLWAPHAQ